MHSEFFDSAVGAVRALTRSADSFDIIERDIILGTRRGVLFYVNGLVNTEILEKLLEFWLSHHNDATLDADVFAARYVPYGEVTLKESSPAIAEEVLSGMVGLYLEGFSRWISIDIRSYPQRQTSEPEDDKVLRGSKDGFVETVIFNLALIRRRIRDRNLVTRAYRVGRESKTDVILCYMDGVADSTLVENLDRRIREIDLPSIRMNQQSIIEALYRKRWLNPFPKVKYTERPDVAAAVCMKGNIVILVDNSPSAILIPTSVFDLIEEADDYYFPPITGTYIRLARHLITLSSVILTPLWLLCLQNPNHVPAMFTFVLVTEPVNLPIFWQLILIEVGIDGLRLATMHTPNSMTSAIGIIGAIAFSQFGIDTGWFTTASVLYMAFVTIANNCQPNYELGYSLKYVRILLLTLTYLLNLVGFIIGLVVIFILLLTNRTLSGKSYLYPLIPLKPRELVRKLTRTRM